VELCRSKKLLALLCSGVFKAFKEATLLHFKKEEDILFPAFEETTSR